MVLGGLSVLALHLFEKGLCKLKGAKSPMIIDAWPWLLIPLAITNFIEKFMHLGPLPSVFLATLIFLGIFWFRYLTQCMYKNAIYLLSLFSGGSFIVFTIIAFITGFGFAQGAMLIFAFKRMIIS